jgi:hypothetical protein
MSTTIDSAAGLVRGNNPIHKVGGNYYAVGFDDTNGLAVWKATSPSGTWTEQDAFDAPPQAESGVYHLSSTVVNDGTDDILVIVRCGSNATVSACRFYCTGTNADTWDRSGGFSSTGFINILAHAVNDDPTVPWVDIAAQGSTNNVVAVFASDLEAIMGDDKERVDYCRSTDAGATWGSVLQLDDSGGQHDEHYGGPTISKGSQSTDVHILYGNQTSTASDPPLFFNNEHGKTLSTTTLSSASEEALTEGPDADDQAPNHVYYDDGGTAEIRKNWFGSSGATLYTIDAEEDGSDDISIVSDLSESFSVNGALSSSDTQTLVVSGTDLYFFFQRISSADLYYTISTDNGATWDDGTELEDAVTVGFITGALIDGTDIHVLWSDSGINVSTIVLSPVVSPAADTLAITEYDHSDIHPAWYRQFRYRFATPVSGSDHEAWTLVGSEDTSFEIATSQLDVGHALIIKVRNTGGSDNSPNIGLEYNKDGAGWNAVNNFSSLNVRAHDSGAGDSDTGTTERLTAGSGDWWQSTVSETGIDSVIGQWAQPDEIEFYWSIVFRSADLSGGESIDFRVVDQTFAYTVVYDITPNATIQSGGDVTRSPDADTLAITEYAPTAEITHFASPAADTLSLTGATPTVRIALFVTPAAASLSITGAAPSVEVTHFAAPTNDALVTTGAAPSAEIIHIRGPPVDTLVLTGQQPTASIARFAAPAQDALALTGSAPSVEITHFRQPAADALVITGQAPVIPAAITRTPAADTLTLTGNAPSVEVEHFAQPAADALVLTGNAPSVERTRTVQPDPDSLALTGSAPSVEITHFRQPAADALALTGNAPSAEITRFAEPAQDALAFTGQTPTAELSYTAFPAADTLLLTGAAPTLELPHIRQPGADTLTLTGQEPTAPAGDNHVRQPDTDALALTGNAPSVEITHFRQPTADALVLTGNAPTLGRTRTVQPASDTLTLTGNAPTLGRTRTVQPAADSLVLAGAAPTAEIDHVRGPATDSLVLTGNAPSVERARTVQPDPDTLSITGQQPTVLATGSISPDADTLILTGNAPSADITRFSQPAQDALTLTGAAPNVEITRFSQPDADALALTGAAPTVFVPSVSLPAADSLTITGNAPLLGGDESVSPAADTLSLTGAAPTLKREHFASPSADTLTLTGSAPTAGTDLIASPATGTLLLSSDAPAIGTDIDATGAVTLSEITAEGTVILNPPDPDRFGRHQHPFLS